MPYLVSLNYALYCILSWAMYCDVYINVHDPAEEKYSEILDYNEDDDTDPGPDPAFFYDLEQLYARARTTSGANSTPSNFLTLFHSFGYECLKR